MKAKWADPKLALSVMLIGLFAYAYWNNPDDEAMKGAMIAAFAAAYGYWLGSSSGSDVKTEHMARHATGRADDPLHIEEE